MTLFQPSLRQIAGLAVLAALALAAALHIRYQLVENSSVGIACETARSFSCNVRRVAIMLFTPSVFGWVALAAAFINLWRPTLAVLAVALAAAGLGLVLYNVQLSALAVGLMMLSLARRAPEPE
jgi:hypothetical protein